LIQEITGFSSDEAELRGGIAAVNAKSGDYTIKLTSGPQPVGNHPREPADKVQRRLRDFEGHPPASSLATGSFDGILSSVFTTFKATITLDATGEELTDSRNSSFIKRDRPEWHVIKVDFVKNK
jgi:hypothetical protein